MDEGYKTGVKLSESFWSLDFNTSNNKA